MFPPLLWVCNETMMHVMAQVMRPNDGWILDKGSSPDIESGVGFAHYVGNTNSVSTGKGMVSSRLSHVTAVLDALG